MKTINLFILSLILLASCAKEVALPVNDTGGANDVTAKVSFTTAPMELKGGVATRSNAASTVDDVQLTDMWVVQFNTTGAYMKKTYYYNTDITVIDMVLAANTGTEKSNLYFLANVGNFLDIPANEAAFKTQAKAIALESNLLVPGANSRKSIPMYGEMLNKAVPPSGYLTPITVTLTRMLARVDIIYTVDPAIASFLKVDQIRVCNVPTTMQFYPPAAGNFPAAPTGSTLFSFPFEATNTPGPTTVTFYVSDNSRGIGANTVGTDERKKVGIANATYIEIIGHTIGNSGGDEVTYRIYPGADNFNDYSVKRNTHYTITTTLKGISASDLRVSLAERSNCYMVKPGQSVNIFVKRANESDLGIQLPDLSTGWTASVYWESTAGLVSVDYSTMASRYFKVTAPSGSTRGNASVVIKDASLKVLWSWHIWVTPYDPETQNEAKGLDTWMRCDLGAGYVQTAAGQYGFPDNNGLYYMWGRKDPFPQSSTTVGIATNQTPIAIYNYTMPGYSELSTSAITGDSYVKYCDASASPVSYTNQLAYSVKYPMLMFANWSGSTAKAAASATVGIDSWGGEYGQPKTVYDPCPAGWRVPSAKRNSSTANSPWSAFVVSSTYSAGASQYAYVSFDPSNFYYPISGSRHTSNGINYNGYTAFWWSATQSGNGSFCYSLYYGGINSGFTSDSRSQGNMVRCVRNW